MITALQEKIKKATLAEPNREAIISYMSLRKAVGWLGIAISPLLIGFSLGFGDCHAIQPTISHYYYTTARELFVGTLCAVSLFLFCYRGCSKWDSRSSNLVGFFGVIVALFPADFVPSNGCQRDWTALINIPYHDRIHTIAAALFFLTLAFISIVIFTLSDKLPENRSPGKKIRNRIYRICGCVMVACVVCIGVYFWKEKENAYKGYFALACETTALFAFGISWLIKGIKHRD